MDKEPFPSVNGKQHYPSIGSGKYHWIILLFGFLPLQKDLEMIDGKSGFLLMLKQ